MKNRVKNEGYKYKIRDPEYVLFDSCSGAAEIWPFHDPAPSDQVTCFRSAPFGVHKEFKNRVTFWVN